MTARKYAFTWDLIGNVELGRPNLGNTTRIEAYRLLQYTFRDVAEQRYGTEAADSLFREAGHLAGTAFYNRFLAQYHDFGEFCHALQDILREWNMAIFRVEKAEVEDGSFLITMSEDLDCSGLPELEYEFCAYDEGFLAGLLEGYTGTPLQVREIDCWCTGDRTCRFAAEVVRA
jgi:predicted hydrocarbon binding protein